MVNKLINRRLNNRKKVGNVFHVLSLQDSQASGVLAGIWYEGTFGNVRQEFSDIP